MASLQQRARELEDLVHDLDMVVYRLERPLPETPGAAVTERARVRRDLELLRDRLEEVVRSL